MSTAAQRSLAAKKAAHARWAAASEAEREEQGRIAHRGFEAKFEREVDPDGVLPPAERARRAASAKAAYMADLQLKSLKARQRRKARRAA